MILRLMTETLKTKIIVKSVPMTVVPTTIYACPKGTIYQDLVIHLFTSNYVYYIPHLEYGFVSLLWLFGSGLSDRIKVGDTEKRLLIWVTLCLKSLRPPGMVFHGGLGGGAEILHSITSVAYRVSFIVEAGFPSLFIATGSCFAVRSLLSSWTVLFNLIFHVLLKLNMLS